MKSARVVVGLIVILSALTACSSSIGEQSALPDTAGHMMEPGANMPILIWEREGGVAGFCNGVVITASGEAYTIDCQGARPDNSISAQVTDAQLTQLMDWYAQYDTWSHNFKDDAVTDSMSVRIYIFGSGTELPVVPVMSSMADFATGIYDSMTQTQ